MDVRLPELNAFRHENYLESKTLCLMQRETDKTEQKLTLRGHRLSGPSSKERMLSKTDLHIQETDASLEHVIERHGPTSSINEMSSSKGIVIS